MEERKVNLEEVLKVYPKYRIEGVDGVDNCVGDGLNKRDVINAIKEACRQVLELAAENALDWDDCHGMINEESITNTINQVI